MPLGSVKQMMNKLDSFQQMLYCASRTGVVIGDGRAWASTLTIEFEDLVTQEMPVCQERSRGRTIQAAPSGKTMGNASFQKIEDHSL
jgi:hypothetical protein